MKHKIRRIIIFALVTWLLINLYAFIMSDHYLYLPPTPASYQHLTNSVKLTLPDSKTITAVYLKYDKAKYTLLYSHGNAVDLGQLVYFLKDLKKGCVASWELIC
ncbi:MAG: hypothetical protein P1U40_00045 [Coxiellaceae bacterium]|nr:hypothetical protein [Coxiellaceae bacterium]